jgi:hypothetical protein
MNAAKHGLSALSVVLPGEDPEELAQLCRDMEADLRPRGALEREMLARVVGLLWRLRRAARAEAALWDRDDEDVIRHVGSNHFANQFMPGCVPARSLEVPDEKAGPAFFADQFRHHKTSPVERLGVHEQRLDRALHAALRRLELLRAARGADGDDDDGPDERANVVVNADVQNEPTAPDVPDAPTARDAKEPEHRSGKPPMASAKDAPDAEDAQAPGVEAPAPPARMTSAASHGGDTPAPDDVPDMARPGTSARDEIQQNEPTAPRSGPP